MHALQWAIGLEWYLLVEDPWRVVMSTDHPNGGSFLAYPQIIRLLMDRTYRQDVLKTVHPRGPRTVDAWPTWIASTRSAKSASSRGPGPAKILGLKNKGHLGPGADADITIYTPHENKQTMFELPRYVIKAGQLVWSKTANCENRTTARRCTSRPSTTASVEADIADWFEKYYSIRFRNYPVSDDYLHDAEQIACRP